MVAGRAFSSKAIALSILLATAAPHYGRCEQVDAPTVHTSVEEGALVSKTDLMAPAPADGDHIIPRRVIENEEGEHLVRDRRIRGSSLCTIGL